MNLKQPTLVQFEAERRQNNVIPPEGSNSFYTIGNGQINLLTKRSDPEDPRFDLFTNSGSMYTGAGTFYVSGDIQDPQHPYDNFTIITGTSVGVNHVLEISKGKLDVHGTLELLPNSQLVIRDKAQVTLYTDSTFIIRDNVQLVIEKECSLTIYGEVNIHLNLVDPLLNNDAVTIDSAAVMLVDGMELLGDRPLSLTDWDAVLRNKIINVNTQGEVNYSKGRVGFTWVDGNPKTKNQLIDITILWGEAIMGDFKFSVLGYPEVIPNNLQVVRQLKVNKKCTLYITGEYEGCRYMHPDLYLGVIVGNTKIPANLEVDGKVVVDGANSSITVDRGSTVHINEKSEVWLNHGAIMRSTHNDPDIPLLYVNGTLYIEDINQIDTFEHGNIVIGENGKIVVFNPTAEERRILWSTPHGIEDTDLYRLFKDRIDHVEYHISENTGIKIDQFYEFFAREFTWWYGKRRIEKAIHDGIIVWHSGAFIELDQEIIPWVNEDCTLYHASRIFKTFGSYDQDKLQECVDRLKYAGAGNIVIRFVYPEGEHEVVLNLEDIEMKNVFNQPMSNMYTLTTSNDGQLFMRNRVTKATVKTVVEEATKILEVTDKTVEFPL